MKAVKTTSRLLKSEKLDILRRFQTASNKEQTQTAAVFDTVDSEWASAKPFSAIPGPKSLPIPYVGSLWRFLPFGTYSNMSLVEVHQHLYDLYGPIIRLSGFGKLEQVIIYDPTYIEKMFRNEGIWPERIALGPLKYYRTVTRRDFYGDEEGLVTSQAEQWQRFRTATNQTMMQPKNAMRYLKPIEEVIDEFIDRIRYIRDGKEEMPPDFIEEINKMSLETFTNITLDTRLGCLSKDLEPDSEAMRMINNVKNSLQYMHVMQFGASPWTLFPTPTWNKFVKAMDEMVEFTSKYIMNKWEIIKKQEKNEDNPNRSILESLLLKTNDPKIPIIMASDTLFAGIDTTSNSLATALYYLAINPDKQEILFEELKKLLPTKDTPFTVDIFNELKYTRASIKESMRFYPASLGNQRMAGKDMVFGEYQIPKGTFIMASHAVMCQMEKHYKRAKDFIPERWLKSHAHTDIYSKNTHPFVFLPFGFGHRSCIGRRFAELEMEIAVAKIIRNFKVSYHYEPMTWTVRLVTSPSKPLKFKMEDRPE